ncbi:endonuclease 8-like 3 [Crassostrea angulata]|uniref:endonuclease 8-like 3 n=1 Tax=Magallana angulata TaxID=2784310 RepID=UPI0022B1B2F6|nr:endonuclease 8-like 3 [Crassostrea angulata]
MVEGPGCKIKGEKIKSKLMKQAVKAVSGNAVDREIKPKKGQVTSQFDVLIGRRLTGVQTLGKELFMYFGDVCLRVHFLMAGSFRVNGQALDKDYGKLTETPSLQVNFSTDVLTFYKSAAQIRESVSCSSRYDALHDLDICSPVFNHQRAVTMVMEQSDRQVCDVLLDQTILPGVGNIIKNEALFDSGIKPSSKVQQLSKELVSHLVKMTRDFSLIFYKCRKTGTNLNQYMKIYNKRKCGQCEGKVTITRIGDDSERVTYYCPNCQTNTLKSQVKVHPCKNSLLGWVQSANQKPEINSANQSSEVNSANQNNEEDWSCQICTLINSGTKLRCEACMTEREATHTDKSKTGLKRKSSTDFSEQSVKKVKESNDGPPVRNLDKMESVLIPRLPLGNIPRLPTLTHSGNTDSQKARQTNGNIVGKTLSKNSSTGIKKPQTGIGGHQNKDVKMNVKAGAPTVSKKMSQDSKGQGASKVPLCPGHSKPCSMTQTRKKGDNFLRWFFSCGVYPRSKQCKFFQWADEKFPICPNHGKPAAFRTVMKEGPNNGRKFFACPLPKQKQCGFFEWAEGFEV